MTRWHPLTPTDDAFLDSAPIRTVKVLEVPVSVERLWEALTADDALVGWGAGVTKMQWLGPKPRGVGTVREVTLGGVLTVREQFYRWDEGKRKSFFVAASTAPGIRRFAEDYVVESTATGSRLTWKVSVEPSHLGGLIAPVGAPVLAIMIGTMVTGLRKHLAQEVVQ
ncbi:MAG: hypothetical protein JWR35_368 [Marmoricola sp.]|jgi:hypothetical protein|nr:hypothetical protein [Marmoricola sp.]